MRTSYFLPSEDSLVEPIVLVGLILAIVLLILSSVFSDPLIMLIHRYVPNFSYEGESLLLWGSAIMAALVIGLIAIYLLIP